MSTVKFPTPETRPERTMRPTGSSTWYVRSSAASCEGTDTFTVPEVGEGQHRNTSCSWMPTEVMSTETVSDTEAHPFPSVTSTQ